MAAKRKRGSSWEYIVKNKKLLGDKPYTRTFASEEEGDATCAVWEAQMALGVIPLEMRDTGTQYVILAELIRDYIVGNSISRDDMKNINIIYARVGDKRIDGINYKWVEEWISEMKTTINLSPSTIRHHVGALGRCFDWASRTGITQLVINPIRQLPKKYAQYNAKDIALAKAFNPGFRGREDNERERRFEPGEEEEIRRLLNGGKPHDKQRPMPLKHKGAMKVMFDLALESAMRMREIYTLTLDQIDLERRTVFLERTKNGSVRQVPLTSVAAKCIEQYFAWVRNGEENMAGFNHEEGMFLPWWDGRLQDDYLESLSAMLSRRYVRIFKAAKCEDLRFHDIRHEATSRFFERTELSEFKIMKITGHSSTKMLKRYANLRGSKLAEGLW